MKGVPTLKKEVHLTIEAYATYPLNLFLFFNHFTKLLFIALFREEKLVVT